MLKAFLNLMTDGRFLGILVISGVLGYALGNYPWAIIAGAVVVTLFVFWFLAGLPAPKPTVITHVTNVEVYEQRSEQRNQQKSDPPAFAERVDSIRPYQERQLSDQKVQALTYHRRP